MLAPKMSPEWAEVQLRREARGKAHLLIARRRLANTKPDIVKVLASVEEHKKVKYYGGEEGRMFLERPTFAALKDAVEVQDTYTTLLGIPLAHSALIRRALHAGYTRRQNSTTLFPQVHGV